MRKRMLAAGLVAVMMTTCMTGCVKVVKIGQEAELTGEQEFNAVDNVAAILGIRSAAGTSGESSGAFRVSDRSERRSEISC